jgi:hypothetical protein
MWLIGLDSCKKAQEPIGQNLCNSNLTPTVTNEDLRNLFSQVAKRIRSDAKNVSQGERMQNMAFVQYILAKKAIIKLIWRFWLKV